MALSKTQLKTLKLMIDRDGLHELVEELIDAATDLGSGQANPLADTKPLEYNLNQAAEKLYNAIDAITYQEPT